MSSGASGEVAQQHKLSDWLALHQLESKTCLDLLNTTAVARTCESAPHEAPDPTCLAPDAEDAWLLTLAALRAYLPDHRSRIDEAFAATIRILVEQPAGSRKALTIDNGPTQHATVLYSYRDDPADLLVIAHEFGHVLQIRASHGKFVTPVVREICAFIGESALLSHCQNQTPSLHRYLLQTWEVDNRKYFGRQRLRLQEAFAKSDPPYSYGWNYPLARYLARQIFERCERDLVWKIFEGEVPLKDIVQKLAPAPVQND